MGHRCGGLDRILPAMVGTPWDDLKEKSVNARGGDEDGKESPPDIPPNHTGEQRS